MVVKMNPVWTLLFFHPAMNLDSSDLKYFPDLSNQIHEEVSAIENYLRVVPEDFLPRGIKRLLLDLNYIKSDGLPVVFPDTIEELSLNCNTITDFREVAHFPTNLKKLSVNKNPLHTFANLCIDSLEELNLRKTRLDTIPLLPRFLQLLHAEYNYLTMLPNRFPTNLRVVHLEHNCLRYASLPGYWGTALEELHLANNKIERFPRNLPPTLQILNLSQNRIAELPSSLNGFPNLKCFSIANNRIRTVSIELRRHPIHLVNLANNELTVSIEPLNRELQSKWASMILEEKNWTSSHHEKSAKRIQKNWRIAALKQRLRTWKRTRVVKEELMCVSMMPERAWQTDIISPEWRRP
jgi:Leucine-rich repeat (LRR) protein